MVFPSDGYEGRLLGNISELTTCICAAENISECACMWAWGSGKTGWAVFSRLGSEQEVAGNICLRNKIFVMGILAGGV